MNIMNYANGINDKIIVETRRCTKKKLESSTIKLNSNLIIFQGAELPTHILYNDIRIKVEKYSEPVVQCYYTIA